MHPAEEFLAASQKLKAWCFSSALPFWFTEGVDQCGRFVETLGHDGIPDLTSPRRVRVQFRQVYVGCVAHALQPQDSVRDISEHAAALALTDAQMTPSGSRSEGYAFTIHPDGRVQDDRRDLYTQAFFLLMQAWRHKSFGTPYVLEEADRLIAFLDTSMRSKYGGFVEKFPSPDLPRRQNPHMHLFEAFIALEASAPGKGYLAYADEMFDLFVKHFFDEDTACLWEYFGEDWSRDPKGEARIEPGHMMEWAWLLDKYARLSRRNVSHYIYSLYESALRIGTDRASGLLWDEVTPCGHVLKRQRRSWPQTEYLKAATVLAANGDPKALSTCSAIINQILATYLNTPIPGLWHDAFDRTEAPVPGPASASSFYHYICAVAEVASLADEIRATALPTG